MYYKKDTPLPPYIPVPHFMLKSNYTLNAKLIYGLLLNRTQLSRKNNMVSADGNVYVIYTVKKLAKDLGRSERTVENALKELEDAGLLIRVRNSRNQPNHIYLLLPDESEEQIAASQTCKSYTSDTQVAADHDVQNLQRRKNNIRYNNKNKTKRETSSRQSYGIYHNVLLSESELSALQQDYPTQYEHYIDRLSSYMISHGRDYTNHYATICCWIREDKLEKPYDYSDLKEGTYL